MSCWYLAIISFQVRDHLAVTNAAKHLPLKVNIIDYCICNYNSDTGQLAPVAAKFKLARPNPTNTDLLLGRWDGKLDQ